jgi:hypothetical protein
MPGFSTLEIKMKYQTIHDHKRDVLVDILEIVNYFLLMIIAACFNYMVIDFLF